MQRGEKGLQVLRDHGVEHRMTGIPRCVGGHRWRHTSPHGQQGENGNARSCPQLYCSLVQYTSTILTWECGGKTRYAPPAPAATLRCPHGGGGKSAFEILIHFLFSRVLGADDA